MFLDAVILILQEILEAALLLSVLLAVNQLLSQQVAGSRKLALRWYAAAVIAGLISAALFAAAMPTVSQWFDYFGQEVTNAVMQIVVIGCLFTHCLLLQQEGGIGGKRMLAAGMTLVAVIALGIAREGSEIFLYIDGIAGTPTAVTPVLLGAGVATGIGISAGVLLYYALLMFSKTAALRIGVVLLALFAGNMAAQAILLLTQADWVPFSPALWDSSTLIPESTVTAKLLYALVGYEATPSVAQGIGYVLAMLLLISTPLFRQSWRNVHRTKPVQ